MIRSGERRDRGPATSLAISAGHYVIAHPAGATDADLRVAEGLKPGEMIVDGARFFAGVGEDREVVANPDVGFPAHQVEAGRLHACPKVQYVIFRHLPSRVIRLKPARQVREDDSANRPGAQSSNRTNEPMEKMAGSEAGIPGSTAANPRDASSPRLRGGRERDDL